MKFLTLFSGSSGLNTHVDKTRVKFDPETGVSDLTVGVNVTHDDTGLLGRRKGRELLIAGDFHSIFAWEDECYIAEGGNLYRLGSDLATLTGVRDGMSGNRIAYVSTPLGIYYQNGFDIGILRQGVSYLWGKSVYVGPETLRHLTGPPVGLHIELSGGYMLIARGDVLWWSQPFAYGLYHMAKDYLPFPSRIRMVKAVDGGVYVSDEKRIYFLAGKNPEEWSLKEKAHGNPALEWSDECALVPGETLGLDDTDALCALWVATDGACYGTPDGNVESLNNKKITYPQNINSGAGLLMGKNFIHSIS